MLTTDLVRVSFRSGRIYPRRIKAGDDDALALARRAIGVWEQHSGRSRGEWEESLSDLIGDSPDFLLARGFAKLLDDRTEWDEQTAVDPVELRRALFERSAGLHPVKAESECERGRRTVVEAVGEEFGITPEEVDRLMYADRREEQRLGETRPITAEHLLERYNLSLVQAILIRAAVMRVRVGTDRPKRLRELFRYLKFYRLMHRAQKLDDGRWEITIDGPLSLFSQSQKYGAQMAMFLPALLLLDRWEMDADIRWPEKNGTVSLNLDHKSGLTTWMRSRGTWRRDEEKMLRERFEKPRSGWQIEEGADVINLGGEGVLVPDLVLRHKDGRAVPVEIVGYWRKGWLERRIELLARHAPKELILCVSRSLATDEKVQATGVALLEYARVIPVTKLVKLAAETSSGA